MTPTLIVICLLGLAVGIVVWATRRKADQPSSGPREGDTAWNDPVTPAAPSTRDETPPSQEPRP